MDQAIKPQPELGAVAEYWKRKWARATAILDAATSPVQGSKTPDDLIRSAWQTMEQPKT